MFSYFSPIPSLPPNLGPHKVGSSVYEVPIVALHSTSPVPDANISTLRFRLFYPTTHEASSTNPIYWVPPPQSGWIKAYAKFLGASERLSSLISAVSAVIKYTTIPAVSNAPLLPKDSQYPVLVFSHGLGGNLNAYSSILCSLASCGVVCIAPEHRDGSAPISFIASSEVDNKKKSPDVLYQKWSHTPTPEILEARNKQLRIRLWELELTHSALRALNEGKILPNLSTEAPAPIPPSFKSSLDLSPSSITWAGHSFGAASVVQLLKSVFWAQALPPTSGKDPRTQPQALYTPAENGELAKQIRKDSPLVLLDIWMMPLDGERTRWLWEKPLPCYAAEGGSNNVLAIMSEGFYKWSGNMDKTKAVLSAHPARYSPSNDVSQNQSPHQPRLFYTSNTAHLSQSDFGVLFPWASKHMFKAMEPARTIRLNVRAILQGMREKGLAVEYVRGLGVEKEADSILKREEEGWVKVVF